MKKSLFFHNDECLLKERNVFKMKKWIYAICFIIIIGVAVITGNRLYKSLNKEDNKAIPKNETVSNIQVQEKEYSVKNDITIQTTTKEEKISPNASLILKKHYKECNHIIKEYAQIPEDFVNLTQEELSKEYPDWTIEKFTPQEVVLIKEEQGNCGEHYILREKDGLIAVYKQTPNGEETLIEMTGISTNYLTKNDKAKIEQGIELYGKEALNSALEDYE